ncbi:MAG: GtrA family protein [Oscillospiraceae bacterium]|nr:GtrA family protein [Oscillospiraceae bacterium]
MIETIKKLLVKYRELIVYVIVGVLTTIVAWGAKFLWNFLFYANTAHPTHVQNLILSTVNWVAGVAFAYPANRKWVFRSKNPEILKEATGFIASRLATWIMDILLMQLLCNVLGLTLLTGTLITAVAVTIGNYVFSKLLVFRKGQTQ